MSNVKVSNKMLIEAMNSLKETVASFDSRISAIESGNIKAKTSNKKSSTTKKSSKKTSAPKTTELEKFEPKKSEDGNYVWASYKACRTAYCYNRLGCKTWKGKVTKPEGFVFDREAWDSAKAEFEKAFKYIKKSDR